MAKTTSIFVCANCGATSPKWIGKCPSCNKFSTYSEEITTPSAPNTSAARLAKPVLLKSVLKDTFKRTLTKIPEFDEVLGGGIVPGSLILIGGDPGIGKSTLLTQAASNLSKDGQKVLYVSAEESCAQVKMRAERLNVSVNDNFYIVNETCLNNLEPIFESYDTVIIDSIQAIYINELSSAAGSVGQVRECAAKIMRIAKLSGTAFFIVGHVTKEGSIAGPKVLEHIMDSVLYFEGETQNNYKLLRAVKNRFGSSMEVGLFEMTGKGIIGVKDIGSIFTSGGQSKNAGSIISPSMSGNRCINVEIQTLLAKSVYQMPRRMPSGIDYNRLVLMLAVLEKRCSIPFYNDDVYISAAGGIKLTEPSCDLAIACALAGAAKNCSTNINTAVFGEVGLTGEVRGVNFAQTRLQECIKSGIEKVVIPRKNLNGLQSFDNKIKIVPVDYCYQAIENLYN